MTEIVEGIARRLAKFYEDGVELMEIHTPKSGSGALPFVNGRRVPIVLVMGDSTYSAGLRATPRNPYVWICPDLRDAEGRKIRLADILGAAKVEKNQKIWMLVDGSEVRISLPRGEAAARLFPEEVEPETEYAEGATTLIQVTRYERDPAARTACIAHHGTRCLVCGIDFGSVYGEIGVGFIHVHHLVPLAIVSAEYVVDPVKDLAPVCPNCHAMLHRKSPPFSINELKLLMGDLGK